jgi:predicted phosphoribosyltransferase
LAVPRGGVPLGNCIAKKFKFPMELLLTKKIGHPMNEELAIGAVGLDTYMVDYNYEVPDTYIESQIIKIRQSLLERHKKFMMGREQVDLEDKIAIIVDDGIATGNTLMTAIKMVKKKNPAKIVIAVPVAPPETANKLEKEVDDFICLFTPNDFYGVGQYYDEFSEVTDDEVVSLLNETKRKNEAA